MTDFNRAAWGLLMDTPDIQTMLKQCLELLQEQRFEEAERILFYLHGIIPYEGSPSFLLGLAAFGQGEIERGLAYIGKALVCDPFNPEFFRQAAVLYQQQGMQDQAVACRMALSRLEGSALISVRHPEIRTPLKARLGTADTEIYNQVFCQKGYDLPFPMSPVLIIDGGANVGYACLFFANRYPDATILAVEPDASNVALLRENTAGYPTIHPLQAAIWPHETGLRIINPGAGKASFRVEEAGERGDLPAITIPRLLAESGMRRIDILKLDIEGAERELFEGDTSWLEHVNVLVVELHDRAVPGCSRALFRALEGRPYSLFQVRENLVFRF